MGGFKMADVTVTSISEIMPQGMVLVRVTMTGATSTYTCPYFHEIIACVGNNETDSDGVGVGVAAPTANGVDITLTAGATDVITLVIAGVQ